VHESHRYGSGYAYCCVLGGVFFTALYTFRMIFMTFHGKSRLDHHAEEHFHDVHWDMKGPLVALAIPSLLIGYLTIGPVLFGDYFGTAIFVNEHNNVVEEIGRDFTGPVAFAVHAFFSLPFLLAALGVATAYVFVLARPEWAGALQQRLQWLYTILSNKYYFDWFNENVLARASRLLGGALWKGGDRAFIDGVLIDGSSNGIGRLAGVVRLMQSGYLYSYAFWMIAGLVLGIGWFLWKA